MMRGVASMLEKHHRVQLLDEALEAAVRLSHRYIPARQLPDKAVSLLDTACARVAVSQHATPAEVEDCQRRIEALQTELEIIGREEAIGIDVGERRQRTANGELTTKQTRLALLQARCEEEKVAGRSDPRAPRASCARGSRSTGPAQPGAAGRRRRQPSEGHRSAREPPAASAERAPLLAELARAADAAGRAAGRGAADPADGRRAGGRAASCRTGPASRSAAW